MKFYFDVKVAPPVSVQNSKTLVRMLKLSAPLIEQHAPFSRGRQKIHLRIFKFPKTEESTEFFTYKNSKNYVALNSNVFGMGRWSAFQYALHGIAHSICALRDDFANEIFAEHMSFSILRKISSIMLGKKSKHIEKTIVKNSHRDYEKFCRAAVAIEKKYPGLLGSINKKASKGRLSKKREKKILRKFFRRGRTKLYDDETPIELEKGFKRLR